MSSNEKSWHVVVPFDNFDKLGQLPVANSAKMAKKGVIFRNMNIYEILDTPSNGRGRLGPFHVLQMLPYTS